MPVEVWGLSSVCCGCCSSAADWEEEEEGERSHRSGLNSSRSLSRLLPGCDGCDGSVGLPAGQVCGLRWVAVEIRSMYVPGGTMYFFSAMMRGWGGLPAGTHFGIAGTGGISRSCSARTAPVKVLNREGKSRS